MYDSAVKRGRFWRLLVGIAVIGCGDNSHKMDGPVTPLSVAEPIIDPLPKGGIATAAKIPACLYWINEKDGSLWRSSLDGQLRELVVDCRALKGGRKTGNVGLGGSPGKKSYLALGSVPKSTGYSYTLVDAAPDIKEDSTVNMASMSFSGKGLTIKAPYSYGGKLSPWTLRVKFKLVPILDHEHSFIDTITLSSSSGSYATYTYSGIEGEILALIEGDFAVLKDGKSIILWALKDDRKYLLAKGWNPRVWPRDLRQPQRFKPIATIVRGGKKLTYVMKDSKDLLRRPEQMTPTRPNQRPPFAN